MTIRGVIKKHGWSVAVDHLRRFQSVDITFINRNDHLDETQFDIDNACTAAGVKTLDELYRQFCQEEKIRPDTVLTVTVSASADAMCLLP